MFFPIKILLLTVLFSNIVLADIHYIDSINSKDFQKLITIVDQDSLILINIDNTLILPKAKMFSPSSPYKNFISDLLTRASDNPHLYNLVKTWLLKRKIMLVEDGWPELLEKLKSNKAKVFGLSQIDLNIYQILKDPEDKQYQELKSLNVQFTENISRKQLIDLKSRQNKHGLFYQGIIFTGPFSRSEILLELLRITTLMPKKIIYIDSNLNNIKQLERYFREFDLAFTGINYLAINKIDKEKIDREIIELQQKNLIDNNKWLEDDEVAKLLYNK